jgi:predicted GTPase
MKSKYKELLQIKKELDEDKKTNKLSKEKFGEFTEQKGIIGRELEELRKKNARTVLIVGEINKGKSTLANVLTSSDHFHENNGSIRNKEVRSKEFDENWLRYRVVDTGGIGEEDINHLAESVSNNSTLEKLTKFVGVMGESLNQLLLVVDSGTLINEK